MKSQTIRQSWNTPIRTRRAFTLIELLVVIAIIGLLSGLVINLLPRAQNAKVRSRVKTELAQLETAIGNYKAKKGFYPPDNPNNPGVNSLFYELVGTGLDDVRQGYTNFISDSGDILPVATVSAAFGTAGFVNSNSKNGADDAQNYHPGLNPNQQVRVIQGVKLLGVAAKGPSGDFCPWMYNSSNPVHNPNHFDLWVEVILNGRTNQIGNWKAD